MPVAQELEYRFLEPDDWPKLAKFYAASPERMPEPARGVVVGAFDGDEIVGFIVAQPAFILESMGTQPGANAAVPGMIEMLNAGLVRTGLGQWFMLSTGDRTHSMLKSSGFESVDADVWKAR